MNIKIDLPPNVLHLRDQGGGLWQVDEGEPPCCSVALPDGFDALIAVDRVKISGIFDEKLIGYRHITGELTGRGRTYF